MRTWRESETFAVARGIGYRSLLGAIRQRMESGAAFDGSLMFMFTCIVSVDCSHISSLTPQQAELPTRRRRAQCGLRFVHLKLP